MKKTIKVNLGLYALSETNLDNLCSEFFGYIGAISGKAAAHEVVFEDIFDKEDPEDSMKGTVNSAAFAAALVCFKLKD